MAKPRKENHRFVLSLFPEVNNRSLCSAPTVNVSPIADSAKKSGGVLSFLFGGGEARDNQPEGDEGKSCCSRLLLE